MDAIKIDQEAVSLVKREMTELEEIIALCDELPLDTDEDEVFVTDTIKEARDRSKKLEAAKSLALDPLKAAVKVIDGWFKPALTACATIESKLKGRILARRRDVEEQRRAALASLQAAETVEEAGEAIAEVQAAKAPEVKGSSIAKLWTWELEDLGQVPPEFLAVDSGEVTKAVRSGAREIPGIRIFQKDSLRIT